MVFVKNKKNDRQVEYNRNPEIYLMYNKYLVYSKDVTAKY